MSTQVVSDEGWTTIAPLLPTEPPIPTGGRLRRISDRMALTGSLFVLKSGIPWEMLPQELGVAAG
jgi:transposase